MSPKIKDPSWEKLKGESSKAFERFKIYRDLPPENRSIERVQEILKEKLSKSEQNSKNKYSMK